ncbi:ABC transporter substrate-binding protein [Pseudogulbenkiania sp. MAI-1]|uniref:substrate-binding periplasmic protein n=1 Tax=Pseudogulbenkiania sp. MAI-1 TaxID=990370 RepID=UPI00045E7613|nr:transporter substrate-binding domain-containing protein [Pseudogulbenkiania sp. MAI-1]
MPRRLPPLVLALLLTMPCLAAERVVLYGDQAYPPYSYLENGEFKGIYVDLLLAAAKRMAPDYRIELQPTPWRRGLAMLENGQALGLFPPYRRPERRYIDSYSIPLYRERVVVVCNRKAMNRPRRRFPEDFGDVVIGVNAGFALSGALVEARKRGQVQVEEANGTVANLRKLALDRIGCYTNDSLSIRYTLMRLKKEAVHSAELDTLSLHEVTELSGEEAYIGYSRHANPAHKADFIRKLDAVLQDLQRHGELDHLVAKYGS